MSDALPKRPRGRPPLKDGEKSISLSLRVTEDDYDRAFALAQKHRTTISGILRKAFAVVTRHKLDEP